MVKVEYNLLTQRPFYVWKNKEGESIRLRRVTGGIGWPSKGRPGFLVVLGESLYFDRNFPDVRQVHVLTEQEEWMGSNFLSLANLLQGASDLQVLYVVQRWGAEYRPEFFNDVREHNKKLRFIRTRDLRFVSPGEDVTPERLAMGVYDRTASQKTMFFHGADRTRAALSSLSRDLSEISWDTSPIVTALLMALMPMENKVAGDGSGASWTPADGAAGY